ncbi:aldose epimerase family protein [Caulobacter sp. NIBR2454]|uniref:aldose epimerase family protein n=1 Tax=Caulobacter sp. NIBR2454 TaxID=3015996 RepID=UPI0022B7184A|nr:aldose epimerase family protein [Caulobacter sp. NIBR2454]
MIRPMLLAASLLLMAAPAPSDAADLKRSIFGKTIDGRDVEAITLTNPSGMSATILTYGATLQALMVPDPAGKLADVVLGYDDVAGYEKSANYFGASVGRYANRIAKGRFELDGRSYQLALNDNGAASLHGGQAGFDKKIWSVARVTEGPSASVEMTYVSPDGEEGYPGTLTTTVTYTLDDQNGLAIDYRATSDRPTIVNLTHHALFNMAGHSAAQSALDNVLQLAASRYLPVDEHLIPTGALSPVEGGVFDFLAPTVIGARVRDGAEPQLVVGRGYDHSFVLDGAAGALRLAARLSDPSSGRTLEFWSDQPGLQLYSGNFIDGTTVGKQGHVYRQGDGVALEPQRFPDAPNQKHLGSAVLRPGQVYSNSILLRASPMSRSRE